MEKEALKKLKSSVEKCIEELSKKPELSAAETKAALDGMQLREWLCKEIEDCEMKEEGYSERGYSRHGEPYRQYHITSYGPMPASGMRAYGEGEGYSSTPQYGVHGWYQSNGYAGLPGYPVEHMRSYCGDPYYYDGPDGGYSERRRYSRHSISDRAVEKLENLMDTAGSEYEREELHKFIRMIRQAAE